MSLSNKNMSKYFINARIFSVQNKLTRITTDSITLIDNIFTNVHDLQTKAGIRVVDISDHLPVFVLIPSTTNNYKSKRTM